MKAFKVIFFLVFCIHFILLKSSIAVDKGWQYHTPPDKWQEPRIFHAPFDPNYENRIVVSHQKLAGEIKEKIFSPNKAYWFSAKPKYTNKLEQEGVYGIKVAAFSPGSPVIIFNERDYVIEVKPSKNDPDYFLSRAYWINEKLIYLEVWWGRVLGSSLIFDVEKESFIYKEMFHEGSIPFMQWKDMKGK